MKARGVVPLLSALAVLAAATAPGAGAQSSADLFADCEARFASGGDGELVQCMYEATKRGAPREEAESRLERFRRLHPRDPWVHVFLGHLFFSADRERADRLYGEAVGLAESRSMPAAEVAARVAWVRHLSQNNDLDKADQVLAKAVRVAEDNGDRELLATVYIRQAYQYEYQGKRLDYAYHLLQTIEDDVFPDGPGNLKNSWLDAMTRVSHVLGRNDEVLSCKRRQLDMAREDGDLVAQAEALFAIAIHHITVKLPTASSRREVRGLLEEALAAAEESGLLKIQALAHFQLGKLAGGEDGRQHLQACLRVAEKLRDPQRLSYCRSALAASSLETDREQARRLIGEVLAAAADSTDPWSLYGWEERLPVHWAMLPRSDAIGRSLSVLDGIETIRESQALGSGRAGLLSAWAEAYYWLSGRLLAGGPPGAEAPDRREDLELAFTVTERLRARVLLETLETARAASPPADEPLVGQLAEILERKLGVQSRLLDPRLTPEARAEKTAELETVESEEWALRERLARAHPSYAGPRIRDFAPLAEIERSLGHDEALLSYQLGLDEDFYGNFAGGSWLLVSTRGGTRSYRLADRVTLDPALDTLFGLADPGTAEKGLARLYRDLLDEALGDLPAGIDRLIIVPDGKLHRLPFALLRSDADADPLIARYQLSLAPSATLWLRWRQLEPATGTVPALVFADPLIPGQEPEDPGSTRGWALARGAALAPLPYAREEGRAVVRILGGDSRLLERDAATEVVVKNEDLRQFGILHFAAHAVIDEQIPERSAVFLTPVAEVEDGWLQPQEIVRLDLRGRVVVLASCDTAAGQILRGEGAMSLARSFFQAGAPVVVASLWQLPDDRTSRLFKRFYRQLARGASVAEAMAAAQRQMIRRGASGREWAGLVVLGDGALVPFPGGLPRPIPYLPIAVIALAAAVVAAIFRRRSLQG